MQTLRLQKDAVKDFIYPNTYNTRHFIRIFYADLYLHENCN